LAKVRFSAPQTDFTSWLLRGVVKIATFAKPETVKVQLIDIQHTVATQELSPFEAEARLNPFKKAK
jgi:hypothetical protein